MVGAKTVSMRLDDGEWDDWAELRSMYDKDGKVFQDNKWALLENSSSKYGFWT